MKAFLVLSAIMISLLTVSAAEAIVPSYSDLWDISNGTSVTGSSPILNHGGGYNSDARDMFGGSYGPVETGNTVFEDWNYYRGTQWITWHTATPVTIGSFNLFATDYQQPRSFSSFQLYATDFLSPVYTFVPTTSFGGTYSATITPVTAQDFKAVFGWDHTGGDWNSSARITELDGFAPQQAVPEPASMSLLGLGLAGLLRLRKKRVS